MPGFSCGTTSAETGPSATSGTAMITTWASATAVGVSVTSRPPSRVRCCPAGELSL
jgi:hypothetical protein